jgi:hypothetical protein
MDQNSIKIIDRVSEVEAINRMPEEDLRFLNRLIVERIKLISQARATGLMTRFTRGDRVRFDTNDGRSIEGRVERLNTKTITVLADGGQRWKVSPGFLRLIQSRDDVKFPWEEPLG